MLPLLVGVLLAVSVGWMAARTGLDRDRALYPVTAIVIASLYALFAVMGGSMRALATDSAVGAVFIVLALAGFRGSLWIVVGVLAAHGILDGFHGAVLPNPGVPGWWPPFCAAYDLTAAAYLAGSLRSGRIRVAP